MSSLEEVLSPGQNIKPTIDAEKCRTLIEHLYGYKCSDIMQMDGYDDKNYKVIIQDGDTVKECVCKIMNSLDSKKLDAVEAQCEFLLHLSAKGIPCPKPLKNLVGRYYSVEKLVSGNHVFRLLTYLPGLIIHEVPPSTRLLFEAGKYVAKLDSAARTFHHHGYISHKSIWMLEALPHISKFLYTIHDIDKRQIIEETIKAFKERILPIKDELEKGMIHGDFNEQNIVVQNISNEWKITGILDFGDSHFDCYVFELAITIAYMTVLYRNLDAAGYVIAGYSSVRRPTDREFTLLKICVAARLCQSLVMSAYSILQDPENVYILASAPVGWKMLIELWSLDEEVLLRKWKTIADSYLDEI